MALADVLKKVGKAVLPRSLEEKFGLASKPMVFEIGEGLGKEQKKEAEAWLKAYEAPKFEAIGIPFGKKEMLISPQVKKVIDWTIGDHLLKPYSDQLMGQMNVLVKEGVSPEKAQKVVIKRELTKKGLIEPAWILKELTPEQLQKLRNYEMKEMAWSGVEALSVLPMGRISKIGKAAKGARITKRIPKKPPKPAWEVIKTQEEINKALAKLNQFDKETLKKIAEKNKKTNKFVADLFRKKIIKTHQVPSFKNWGYTEEEAAQFIENFATFGGKDLNRIAQWNREINKIIPDDVLKVIEKRKNEPAGFFNVLYHKVPVNIVNFWRAALTSQLATAVRNAAVGLQMFSSRIMENAVIGATKIVTGKAPARRAFRPMVEDMITVLSRTKPEMRKKIAQLLEENPLAKFRLYSTPVNDVALTDKAAKVATIFNRTQEFAIRNLVFEAVVREELASKGLDLAKIPLNKIPKDVVLKGVDEALKVTMASAPKGFFAELVKWWNKTPTNFLSVLLYPFPRYLSNAVRWIYGYTPFGVTRFLKPETRKLLLQGDKEAARAAARVFLGTLYFLGALKLRNSKYAGEKWYQVKVKGKTVDVRPFGPLIPTYLFLAEAVSNPKKLGVRDYTEGLLGIRRLAGTTLFLVDLLDEEQSWKSLKKSLHTITQNFIGGFGNLWPIKTTQDIIAQFDKAEATIRYTRGAPLWAKFQAKVPYWSRKLPPYPDITKATPLTSDYPLLRQFTGLSVRKEKNFTEQELDKLGISYYSLWPKTGYPEIDRLIAEKTGIIMEEANKKLEKDYRKYYDKLNDYKKEKKLRKTFAWARKQAKQFVLETQADWLAEMFYEDFENLETPEEKEKYIDTLDQKGFLTKGIVKKIIELHKSSH